MKLPFGLTGIWGYLAIGLAALAFIAVIVGGVKACKQIDQENDNTLVNAGITQERSQGQAEVINHVQEAHNAVNNPTSNDLNVVCSKYDRNC
jgi:hypothetical protein